MIELECLRERRNISVSSTWNKSWIQSIYRNWNHPYCSTWNNLRNTRLSAEFSPIFHVEQKSSKECKKRIYPHLFHMKQTIFQTRFFLGRFFPRGTKIKGTCFQEQFLFPCIPRGTFLQKKDLLCCISICFTWNFRLKQDAYALKCSMWNKRRNLLVGSEIPLSIQNWQKFIFNA